MYTKRSPAFRSPPTLPSCTREEVPLIRHWCQVPAQWQSSTGMAYRGNLLETDLLAPAMYRWSAARDQLWSQAWQSLQYYTHTVKRTRPDICSAIHTGNSQRGILPVYSSFKVINVVKMRLNQLAGGLIDITPFVLIAYQRSTVGTLAASSNEVAECMEQSAALLLGNYGWLTYLGQKSTRQLTKKPCALSCLSSFTWMILLHWLKSITKKK